MAGRRGESSGQELSSTVMVEFEKEGNGEEERSYEYQILMLSINFGVYMMCEDGESFRFASMDISTLVSLAGRKKVVSYGELIGMLLTFKPESRGTSGFGVQWMSSIRVAIFSALR